MIPDRLITISNLDTNIMWIEDLQRHHFDGWKNVTMAMRDAMELLKEQEAKPIIGKDSVEGTEVGTCPRCNRMIVNPARFCRYCGQEVKWE